VVKVLINANRANFTDFDSVKDAYVEFKCTQNLTHDPRTRQVASVARGGCGGGGCPHKQDHGQGPQTSDKCQKGLVPQAEVDKQTHIVDRHYSKAKFNQLTPAEMQKLWQLRNVGKTPGTRPTRRDHGRAVASTFSTSGSSGKHQVQDHAVKSNQPNNDQKWGRNQDNPALGRQVHPRGNDNLGATPDHMTHDQTISWSPGLTQTIETLRTIRLNLDRQLIVKDVGYKLESNYETTLELDSHANTCV
jgi:hypothetical protein